MWWNVGTSLTLQERGWEMLERAEPLQAAYLRDIDKIKIGRNLAEHLQEIEAQSDFVVMVGRLEWLVVQWYYVLA